MLTALFEGWLSRSNTNGGSYHITGVRRVYIARIPEGAPEDWNTGPKQKPGYFGAYLEHLFYPSKHGAYAFHVAKTEIECAQAVASYFRERRSEWQRIPANGSENTNAGAAESARAAAPGARK